MKKKTVFITGSSSGIGRATALLFQKRGWNVIATMRSPEKEKELRSLDNVAVLKLDVTQPNTIREAVKKAVEKFGDIDVVVNNAGYGLTGAFETASEEQARRQFEVNLFGVMNVTRAILPLFRKKKSGVLVNVASMGGRAAFPLYSLYNSSKWAVEGFSESLQYELRPLNIKVRIIEPGLIRTDFHRRSLESADGKKIGDYDEAVSRLPKYSDEGGSPPEEVAETIYEAAASRGWRLRYQTGKYSRLVLLLRRVLPESWFTHIIRNSRG